MRINCSSWQINIYLSTFLAAGPCNCSPHNVHLLSGKPCWLYPWPAALPWRNEAKGAATEGFCQLPWLQSATSTQTRDASVTSLSAASCNSAEKITALCGNWQRASIQLYIGHYGFWIAAEKRSCYNSNSQTIAQCTLGCSVDFNYCFERCKENGVMAVMAM